MRLGQRVDIDVVRADCGRGERRGGEDRTITRRSIHVIQDGVVTGDQLRRLGLEGAQCIVEILVYGAFDLDIIDFIFDLLNGCIISGQTTRNQ